MPIESKRIRTSSEVEFSPLANLHVCLHVCIVGNARSPTPQPGGDSNYRENENKNKNA